MRQEAFVLPQETPLGRAAEIIASTARAHSQRLYPIVDADRRLLGVATRGDIEASRPGTADGADGPPIAAVLRAPVVARADEPVRSAIHRMAEMGFSRLPVVDASEPPRLVGLITLKEALTARARHLEEERRRERVLPLSAIVPFARRRPEATRAPSASRSAGGE